MKFGYHPDYGFSDEMREKAVRRAEIVGAALAAEENRVSVSSVYNWMKARKKQEESK